MTHSDNVLVFNEILSLPTMLSTEFVDKGCSAQKIEIPLFFNGFTVSSQGIQCFFLRDVSGLSTFDLSMYKKHAGGTF